MELKSVKFATTMDLIATTGDLAAVCARMAKHPYVTVDTEFLRETTYYPLLCVAQMASPEEAVVIDALANGIDLTPFFALMANESVMKVFHAARQDIEIVWNMAKTIPHPIVDTQVAAMVLGYGDSISYDQLVQRITGDALDKSHRFTDWTRRPLSDAQVAYALSDVTHLRDVYLKLAADLEKRGRSSWVEAEMDVLTSPETYRADPERAWERLKSRVRKPKELGADRGGGMAGARGPDATCRGRVIRTKSLVTLPYRRRQRSSAWGTCAHSQKASSIPLASSCRCGQAGASNAMSKRCRGSNDFANGKRRGNSRATKVLLRMTAERHGVAAKLSQRR